MSKPARLHKEEPRNVPPVLSSWMFIHPAAIIIAILIGIGILSALLFAINGGCTVESGVGRNLMANL